MYADADETRPIVSELLPNMRTRYLLIEPAVDGEWVYLVDQAYAQSFVGDYVSALFCYKQANQRRLSLQQRRVKKAHHLTLISHRIMGQATCVPNAWDHPKLATIRQGFLEECVIGNLVLIFSGCDH